MAPKFKSSPLTVGSKAPDFTLPDQDGNDVNLYALLQGGPVVVYFYPKTYTTVCTAEACSFRDSHELFSEAGASVVGISTDSIERQHSFHKRFRLTYPVLSDGKGRVHGQFGVRSGGGLGVGFLLNDRLTFVIDRDGSVRDVFRGLLVAGPHVKNSLATVRSLVDSREPDG
ncbi:MAG: peroxiredoxin [Solirubrobacterales bacterium]